MARTKSDELPGALPPDNALPTLSDEPRDAPGTGVPNVQVSGNVLDTQGPKFVKYVRAVEGHAVQRWGASAWLLIGGRVSNHAERQAGKPPIQWDLEEVVGLTEEYYAAYRKEFDGALRDGSLLECSEDDFKEWLEVVELRELELEAAGAEAKAKRQATQAEAEKQRAEAQRLETEGRKKRRAERGKRLGELRKARVAALEKADSELKRAGNESRGATES